MEYYLAVKSGKFWDFPGGPGVRTSSSQSRGPKFDPWSGNWIPHATTKNLHATTKDPASGAVKLKSNKLLYYFVLGRTCYLDNQYKYGIKYLEELLDIEKKLNITIEDNFDDKDVLFLLFKCYSSLPSIDQVKCKYLISELMKDDPKNVKWANCGDFTVQGVEYKN